MLALKQNVTIFCSYIWKVLAVILTIGVIVGEYKPANLQGEDFEALIAASPPPPSARAPRILLWNIFLEYFSGIFF